MRFVVASSNMEDSVRVFGAFADKEKALALAASVNAKIEKQEDVDFAEWEAARNGQPMPGYGRCTVLVIHKWSVQRAFRFALGEYDS